MEDFERFVRSPAEVFGREPRAGDVLCEYEVDPEDASSLDKALRQVEIDEELIRLLKHAAEFWINGKNPYAVALAEARAVPDSVAVLEGDDGGIIYPVCP